MNHPKVYDAKGRVLEVGSQVENAGLHGSVLVFSMSAAELYVDVAWGDCPNCEDGAVVEPACCGNTTSSGECRGDCAVPSEEPCPHEVERLQGLAEKDNCGWLAGKLEAVLAAPSEHPPFSDPSGEWGEEIGDPLDRDLASEIRHMVECGDSPEAHAARVLRKFMCCPAGRHLVEYGLLRPFGLTAVSDAPSLMSPETQLEEVGEEERDYFYLCLNCGGISHVDTAWTFWQYDDEGELRPSREGETGAHCKCPQCGELHGYEGAGVEDGTKAEVAAEKAQLLAKDPEFFVDASSKEVGGDGE